MDNEVPCRDTDPVNMNLVNKSGDTMAFTIDFGNTELNQEEKVKKFERFAQRSSLRRVNSPRQQEKGDKEKANDDIKTTTNNNNNTCDTETKAKTVTNSTAVSPTAKDRRNTVVLERSSVRSLSQSRLSSGPSQRLRSAAAGSGGRKSVGGVASNDDALSHTGTYTMEDTHDIKKVNIWSNIG